MKRRILEKQLFYYFKWKCIIFTCYIVPFWIHLHIDYLQNYICQGMERKYGHFSTRHNYVIGMHLDFSLANRINNKNSAFDLCFLYLHPCNEFKTTEKWYKWYYICVRFYPPFVLTLLAPSTQVGVTFMYTYYIYRFNQQYYSTQAETRSTMMAVSYNNLIKSLFSTKYKDVSVKSI